MQKHDLSQNDDPIYDVNNPITFVNQIMDMLHSPPDLVNQTITLSPDLHIICVFIKTLVDKNIINHDLLNSLSELPLNSEMNTSESIMNTLQSRIPLSSRSTTTDLNSCVKSYSVENVCSLYLIRVRCCCLMRPSRLTETYRSPNRIDRSRTAGRVFGRHCYQLLSFCANESKTFIFGLSRL